MRGWWVGPGTWVGCDPPINEGGDLWQTTMSTIPTPTLPTERTIDVKDASDGDAPYDSWSDEYNPTYSPCDDRKGSPPYSPTVDEGMSPIRTRVERTIPGAPRRSFVRMMRATEVLSGTEEDSPIDATQIMKQPYDATSSGSEEDTAAATRPPRIIPHPKTIHGAPLLRTPRKLSMTPPPEDAGAAGAGVDETPPRIKRSAATAHESAVAHPPKRRTLPKHKAAPKRKTPKPKAPPRKEPLAITHKKLRPVQ